MATPSRKGEEEKETVTHFHTQKAEGEPVLSKFTGVSDFCLLWHWVFHFLDKWLANSMLPFFLCSSLVLRCDPPHSTSSFLLRRRRRRCPKATRGGPRRPDAKKNFLRFSFFKKTPPLPSLEPSPRQGKGSTKAVYTQIPFCLLISGALTEFGKSPTVRFAETKQN